MKEVEITEAFRDTQGYSNISDDILVCGDCGKQLVIIKKVKETNEENKFKAMCDYCGGCSFVKTITGKVYISGTEETSLFNIDMTESKVDGNIKRNSVIYVKVKK